MAHTLDNGSGISHGEITRLDNSIEVDDGEVLIIGRTIIHDTPDEQREDSQRILFEVLFKVKDAMVVERHGNTNIV